MSVRRDQVLNSVFLGHPHAGNAAATTMLSAVGAVRQTLDIATLGQGDDYVYFWDEVFVAEIAGGVHDARAALVAILVAQLGEVVLDHPKDFLRIGQQIL